MTMRNKVLKNLKILLVEDEENLSLLLKNAIGDNFYSFSVANNGVDGLNMFQKISPDIVITDIMMPKMTGLEMAKKIRHNSMVPIIILSAYSETDKFLDAIDVGVVKYFIKPFDPDELLDYITTVAQKIGSRLIKLCGGFSYNLTTQALYKNTRYVSLTKKESRFLKLLLENCEDDNSVVNEDIIKKSIWEDEEVSSQRLRTFVKRLRAKTLKDLVLNLKGEGYQINRLSSPNNF